MSEATECRKPGCHIEIGSWYIGSPLACPQHACQQCSAKGEVNGINSDDPRWVPCPDCKGKGYNDNREV